MNTVIKWNGIEYDSAETCSFNKDGHGIEAKGNISGSYEGKEYHVEYHIKAGTNWLPFYCEVFGHVNSGVFLIVVEKNKDGSWKKNGAVQENLQDCEDVDISVTPFTNTFPVNRLKQQEEDVMKIQVVYIDILEQVVKPAAQQYTRLNDHQFKFEKVPNDFEAIITTDENGFVMEYPGLFERHTSA